jgi:hypothetical protein
MEHLSLLFKLQFRVRIISRIPLTGWIVRIALLHQYGAPQLPGSAQITTHIHCHANKPGLKWLLRIKSMKVFERSKKNLLRRILRVFHDSKQPPRQRQHAPLVPHNDLFKCGSIAGCSACEKYCQFGEPLLFLLRLRHPQ